MTTEQRNDVGELGIDIESKPRALDDIEIDSVAGGGNELFGVVFLGPLIGTLIGQAVGGWADDGTDTATPATPHRPS